MAYTDILVEKTGTIAVLTMNRPKKLNALRTQTGLEMKDALENIDRDEGIHCVILTGAGGNFSSGHDTQEPSPDASVWLSRHSPGRIYTDICEMLLRLRQPVVAAINGWCAGGGIGLALSCDILIAADDMRIYVPQIAYGYPSLPATGVLLYRFCSAAWAKDIIMGRRKVDAATALQIGLVTRVVPQDQLMHEARQAAEGLASVPPDIMAMQREVMNRIWLSMGGLDAAMVSGRHTSIAGHIHPDWQSREANWKVTQGRVPGNPSKE